MRAKAVVALALTLSLAAPAARAQHSTPPAPTTAQVEEARQHFTRGVDLYKEGDYRGCLLELRRAQQIAPNYRILFNIGQTLMLLQQYAGARDAYKQYLEQGGAAVPKDRLKVVQDELARLETRVGKLDIKVNVAGAEVVIDDESVGTAPLTTPLEVSAGRRKVTASSGRGTVTRLIDVIGGETVAVELTIVESNSVPTVVPVGPPGSVASTATRPSGPTEPPEERASSGSAAPWVSLTITGLLAAGAVTTGFMALGAKKDLNDRIDTPGTSTSRIDDARDSARVLGITTDALAAAAIIGAGVTTYLFIVNGKRSSGQTTPPPNTTQVGFGVGRLSLSGSF